MTILQIILIIAASIFIGIPLYLFVGKAGRELGAVMVGVFYAILFWDSKKFQKTYDELINDEVAKVLWLFIIVFYLFLSIIFSVIRLGWLAGLAIKAGAKFYWKVFKYCWE